MYLQKRSFKKLDIFQTKRHLRAALYMTIKLKNELILPLIKILFQSKKIIKKILNKLAFEFSGIHVGS